MKVIVGLVVSEVVVPGSVFVVVVVVVVLTKNLITLTRVIVLRLVKVPTKLCTVVLRVSVLST